MASSTLFARDKWNINIDFQHDLDKKNYDINFLGKRFFEVIEKLNSSVNFYRHKVPIINNIPQRGVGGLAWSYSRA